MIVKQAYIFCNVLALAAMMPKGIGPRFALRGGASNLAHPVRRLFFRPSSIAEKASATIQGQSGPKTHNDNSICFLQAAALVLGRLSVFAPIRFLGGPGRFSVSEFAGGARVAQPVGSLR